MENTLVSCAAAHVFRLNIAVKCCKHSPSGIVNTVAVPRGLDPTILETAWGLSDVERDGMLILDGTIGKSLAHSNSLNVLTCANMC
jgi:hypothetical protein